MLENLNGIVSIVSIVLIFVGLFAVGTFLNSLRTTLFSNVEIDTGNNYKLLVSELEIEELSVNEDILPDDEPTTGDFEASVRMLVVDNGAAIKEKK